MADLATRPVLLSAGAGLLLGIAVGYGLSGSGDPAPDALQPSPDGATYIAAQLARLQGEHEALREEYGELLLGQERLSGRAT